MVPDTNQAKLCYCAALAAAWCPLPSLVCSAASHICKIIWHERRDSAAASHVAERKRTDKKCVRPGTHSPGFLSDDLVGVGQLDPAALAVAALPTASPNLSGHGTPAAHQDARKKAGPDIPSFLSSHFVCSYVPRLRHELYHSVRDRLVISSTPCWPPCRVPCWPGRRPPRQRLGPVAASAFSSRAKRPIFGPGTFHTRPGHVQDLPAHDLCVLGGSAADLLTWRRGGVRSAFTGRPLSRAVSAVVWGFPYLEIS